MRTEVETRRLRTWAHDEGHIPQRPWRIILKFGYLRMSRNGYLVSLGIIIAVVELLTIAGMARGIASADSAPGPGELTAAVFGLVAMGVVALVLIGAPLFADDLRFNAPLFYFSRPLRPDDYLRGKALQVASVILAVTILPLVIFIVLGLTLGSAAGTPTGPAGIPLTASQLADFHESHVLGFAQWLYAGAVLLAGVTVVMAFLLAVTLCASAYTRRGWHAGMAALAVIGGWGLIGASATLGAKGAYSMLFGPFGWMTLVLQQPMAVHFRDQSEALPLYLRGHEWAIPIAYLFLIGTTFLALGATVRRLRRVEALL